MLDRLRALREASLSNQRMLQELNSPAPTYQPQYYYSPPVYYPPEPIARPPDLRDQLLADFWKKNQHIVDAREHEINSRIFIDNLLPEFDEDAYDDQINQLDFEHPVPNTVQGLVKQIRITDPRRAATPVDTEEELDMDPEQESRMMAYIDTCYRHIIKVLKVYFILSDGSGYALPSQEEVDTMKELLEGHIHIPDHQRIESGTHVYYLTVNDDLAVVMDDGYVWSIIPGYVYLINDEHKKKVSRRCPMFKKLTNADLISGTLGAGLNSSA